MQYEADDFKALDKNNLPYVEDQTICPNAWGVLWLELRKNPVAFCCIMLLLLIAVFSALAFLSPYDPYVMNAAEKLQKASVSHWCGTDEYGRDYFTRMLYGGRISLSIGVLSMLISVTFGTVIGIASGYIGGKVDMLLMRLTDVFLALPSMLLIVIINSFLRPGILTLILVLSIFSWANVARIVRAETLSLKERDFVVAARNLGVSGFRIAISHILPNMLGSIIVAASLNVAVAILMESSLSFLGLGVSIPYASWGSMLQNAQKHFLNRPMLSVYPGVMILITVMGFNLLGDILRKVFDPKALR